MSKSCNLCIFSILSINCANLLDLPQWYTGNMKAQSPSGYRELPHTADWELEVWAPDLAALLAEAARGMYHLSEAKLEPRPRITRVIEMTIIEPETLLVDFLAELLFITEMEGIGFDEFNLQIDNKKLIGEVSGAKLASLLKEIKAVTYHNIDIRNTGSELKASIVFDV
jgi:SHS2 domain-containing protein